MVIEVAYTKPDEQTVIELDLAEGSSVADALILAAQHFKDLDIETATVGVFGEICERDKALTEWDRVEIYRPLMMDAKEARHQRALEQQREQQTDRKDKKT